MVGKGFSVIFNVFSMLVTFLMFFASFLNVRNANSKKIFNLFFSILFSCIPRLPEIIPAVGSSEIRKRWGLAVVSHAGINSPGFKLKLSSV